ncbi:MAG: hypothetical protein JXQ30_10905 [Spirochaetes bacterium]|nr:hypothetical protein [Spirochaetota bacterium]
MAGKDLKKLFADPPREYGPAPFWFLNEQLDEEELSWQIGEMREKGLSGYVMHPRYGLEVPYLSEEWFKKIAHIIAESEKQGMDAIIYDESDWPSGMSGTRVLDDHPEYILTYLDISWIRCSDRKAVDVQLEKGKVVAIHGARCSKAGTGTDVFGLKLENLRRLDRYAKDGRFRMENDSGLDVILFFVEKEMRAFHPKTAFPQPKPEDCPFHQPHGWDWYFPYGKYVDLFNPKAVDYFLETTHEEYKKRFKKSFGGAVTKVFTDEPGFYTIMREGASAVPWSRIFQAEFEKEYGYSIVDKLPALVSDMGEKTPVVRHDFWEKLTSMFEKNYVKRCADWCEKNGLELMGHFRLCNPFLLWQMVYQGNAIPGMARMHIPGVDALDNVEGDLNLRWGVDEDVWQIESKLVSSVGRHYKKRRVMSESYALGGWKYRMEDMKILTDWQYMMGINFMVPHAFHFSISAQRKRECPPSQFYQNPMWDNYGYFSRYLARLGVMTIDADFVCDIALLYPMESLWAEYESGTTDRFPWDLSDDFSYVTDRLLRLNTDYDILGQDSLERCTIEDGSLRIGTQKYPLLILPPMTTLRRESAETIVRFAREGGKVVFLSLMPYKDTGGKPLSEFTAYFEKRIGLSAKKMIAAYKNRVKESSLCGTENIRAVGFGPLFLSDPRGLIENQIVSLVGRDVGIRVTDAKKANIYCSHWRKEDKDIYFIVNSDERSYSTEVRLRATGEPSFWNPETGERRDAYCYRIDRGYVTVPCRIKPLESFFLVIDGKKKPAPPVNDTNMRIVSADPHRLRVTKGAEPGPSYIDVVKNGGVKHIEVETAQEKEVVLTERWSATRHTPNVLVLNRWHVTQGFSEGVGWFNMLGGTVTWEAFFRINRSDGDLRAIFDRVPSPCRIEINGKPIRRFEKSAYLDHGMKEVDIKRLVKKGENRVTIGFELPERAFQGKTGIEPIELMFDPVMIVGDFSLVKEGAEGEYAIDGERNELVTGTWTDQGYPYFSGSIEYGQHVYFEDGFTRNCSCFLEAQDIREIASLCVNGRTVGLRPWKPYRWDVTGFLKPGGNDIRIRVWNTLTNLLDLKKYDSGIVGRVRIVSQEIVTVETSR